MFVFEGKHFSDGTLVTENIPISLLSGWNYEHRFWL